MQVLTNKLLIPLKTILISHFGRPNGSYFKEYSLIQVVPLLEKLLNFPIKFSSEIIGENVKKPISDLFV